MTDASTLAVYRQMQEAVLTGEGAGATLLPAELLSENALIETPFAPKGMRRYEGRAAWLDYYEAAGAGLLIDFEDFRELATHTTTEPEVLIAEYELTGTVRASGTRSSVTCIAVLRVRGGKIVNWREYQDLPAITEALSRVPK